MPGRADGIVNTSYHHEAIMTSLASPHFIFHQNWLTDPYDASCASVPSDPVVVRISSRFVLLFRRQSPGSKPSSVPATQLSSTCDQKSTFFRLEILSFCASSSLSSSSSPLPSTTIKLSVVVCLSSDYNTRACNNTSCIKITAHLFN